MVNSLIIKSNNPITSDKKHKLLFTIAISLGITTIIILAAAMTRIDPNKTNYQPSFLSPTDQTDHPLKSIRLDLSSMDIPTDQTAFTRQIIDQVVSANANTIFINPWSDGQANYSSQVAPLNQLGQQSWLEDFIDQAHTANLQVYAWFVVGKDNFPAQQHPEWYAQTIQNKPYQQADEPGVNLPFASLANQQYLDYHLAVVAEVNQLPIDGWVISEPLIGWGDKYDNYYTDFSPAALNLYHQQGIDHPQQEIINSQSFGPNSNQTQYQKLIEVRSNIVTNFVSQTMSQIRQDDPKPIIITVFTEPDQQGNLVSFANIKEWLGTDIIQLVSLKPDIIEIQSLFLDFEYPQDPAWTANMLQQFQNQLNQDIPLAISVQGFDSQQKLSAADFSTAINTALKQEIAGISFYAYHTLSSDHWQQLAQDFK